MNLASLKKLITFWKNFLNSKSGKSAQKILQWLATGGIFLFLFYQLHQIGWRQILRALPSNPLFYGLFLLRYLALPISEQFIYRLSLNFSFWEGFKVFMIKKILNSDLVAYSGEAYFFTWAKNNLQASSKHIFHVVKDNNIISAFTSTLTAIVLLTVLIYYEQINFLDFLTLNPTTFLLIIGFVVGIIVLVLFFRKKIINFDTPTTLKIFGIHQTRILFVYSLDILQYIVALPLIPLDIWFTFLAIQIIYTRIPFLPSQEILLLGIYAKVTAIYDVPQAEIMAVFLTITALSRLVNFVFYFAFAAKTIPRKAEDTA